MRTESQTRWEKGVDSGARRTGRDATRRSCSSSSPVRAGPARPRCAAQMPPPAGDRLPPGHADRGARARDRRRPSSASACSGSASPSAPTGRVERAVVARARRAARDRRRRGGRALPARGRAGDAAGRGRRCSGGSRTTSGCGARSRTCSSAPGFYEAYTYSLQPEDPDPTALELPVPLSSQQRAAAHDAAGRPARRGARTTSTWGTTTSRCSRSRTSTCR